MSTALRINQLTIILLSGEFKTVAGIRIVLIKVLDIIIEQFSYY